MSWRRVPGVKGERGKGVGTTDYSLVPSWLGERWVGFAFILLDIMENSMCDGDLIC